MNKTESLKKQFGVLSIGCLLYACFYAFCMYKNSNGITYPLLLAGSLWFYGFCMKKLDIALKKDSKFYIICILLLGISTFCTADGKMILLNKTGVLILTLSFLLHQFFADENWSFGRYTGYVFATLFGCWGEIARPFQDMAYYVKNREKKGKGHFIYVIVGLSISVPLFFVMWMLLVSADRVFLELSTKLFSWINLGNLVSVFLIVCGMFFFSYWILSFLCRKPFSEEAKEKPQAEPLLAISVTIPLMVLYLVFCGVQIVCLFMGKIDLERYTYAAYAREGFFQLMLVCAINLTLVLVGHAYFKESKVLKAILTIVSVCTFIMIASSAFRMLLYIRQYYLTFLRIFVLWTLAVLFILLVGVVISIYQKKFPLFRYSMLVVSIGFLILSFAHPDYWIAKCNATNMGVSTNDFFDAGEYDDYYYLTTLSADAAPALKEILAEEGFDMSVVEDAVENEIAAYERYGGFDFDEESWGYYYLQKVYNNYEEMGVRSFNLSRFIAYHILK